MGKFKTFLAEEEKNKHLEHLEDEIFNRGAQGLRDSISFLQGLRNMLAGHSEAKVNVTVKWDGAPAIVCGTDPETGRFFLGTKSVFNKVPKVNFSVEDIYKNHSGPLADTLAIAFRLLQAANIKEVLQGDLLYTRDTLKMVKIGEENCISFRPNTITYAVPSKSALGQKIAKSSLGVVFHTTYKGKKLQDMKASFGANVDKLKSLSSVWVNDASYRDESGTVSMTAHETASVTALLSMVGHCFQKLDTKVVDSIAKNDELRNLIKQFNNSKVKAGKAIANVDMHVHELLNFVDAKFKGEIDALKTDKGKDSKRQKHAELSRFLHNSKAQLHQIFEIQNLLTDAKNIIIKKLQAVKTVGTFLETPDGFKVTAPEGFVAIDNVSGKAIKLVDRLEFSYANFTATKNW